MAAHTLKPQSPFGASGALLDEEPRRWLPKLTELLDEQCVLCASLDSLSLRQTQSVSAGDTDSLLRILGERQVVIERVSAINAMLEPFRSGKERVMARLSAPERVGLTERITRINRLVEGVQTRDDADRKSLEAQRAGLAGEISGVSRARGAVAAYGPPPTTSPRRQDRHG